MKGFFYRNWEEPAYLGPLVLIRVFCGYYFLSTAITKLGAPWFATAPYTGMIQKAADTNISPGYKAFLLNWVIPNIEVFRFLNWFGEIALGVALVLGLFTRLAALVAIFVLFNYWYAMGGSPAAAPGTPQIIKHMAFGLAVVFLTAAGRSFGFDRALHQQFPRNPLF
ncbi:MAG: DoxX family membrane protein [Candidatus Rokubacteria bacterium]|nr:DoxX family membrane protein [Candidatus Rokubacteria bacterium]